MLLVLPVAPERALQEQVLASPERALALPERALALGLQESRQAQGFLRLAACLVRRVLALALALVLGVGCRRFCVRLDFLARLAVAGLRR